MDDRFRARFGVNTAVLRELWYKTVSDMSLGSCQLTFLPNVGKRSFSATATHPRIFQCSNVCVCGYSDDIVITVVTIVVL